jgi:hypothetical protein
MTLQDFWPAAERIHSCLSAVQNGDPELTLAVHQPMKISRAGETATDRKLFEILLSETGSRTIAVAGAEGIGKSHFINWLKAKWNREFKNANRMLLTFKSSDSRQNAIERLAEAFPDTVILKDAKRPANAFDATSPEAPQLIRQRFMTALEKTETEAKKRLAEAKERGTSPGPQDRDVGTWLAKGLRDFFGDPVSGRPFLAQKTGVFWQLASVESSTSPWCPEQFARQEGVDILKAGNAAQAFYKKLNLTSDQFRVASATLMNELTPGILAALAPTTELPIGVIVKNLQQELAASGREFLLLIEESNTEGDLRELAKDGESWQIESRIFVDRSELIDAVGNFIGSYLFVIRGDVGALHAEDRACAAAFGESKSALPLFPFNRPAIQQILGLHTVEKLHPKQVIQQFIEAILVPYREGYLEGRFPPANWLNFDTTQIGEEVRQAVELQHPDKAGEYLSVLAFWGGCPANLENIHLAERIYCAFGLEPIAARPTKPVTEPLPQLPPVGIHPEVEAFFNALQSGGAGLELLTEEVLRWLVQTQQMQDFSIVRNPPDEIACGLS